MSISSLQQYLDLYTDNRQLLEEKSAPGFNRLRPEAFRNLSVLKLPEKGEENYELIDLPSILAPDFGVNIARIPVDIDPREAFKCSLPNLSSAMFFLFNDMWGESKKARQNLPEGIEIAPLSSALQEGGGGWDYYGKLADMANPIVALNTLLCQEGVFVRVKKNITVDRPVQILKLLENALPLIAFRRMVIVIEEGASLAVLGCDHTVSPSTTLGGVGVVEIFVGKNARLDYYEMEESSPYTARLSSIYVHQQQGSNVNIENFTLHNGKTRNEYNCVYKGEDAQLKLGGLGITNGENLLDNYSHVSHEAKGCHTDELFKYIADGKSACSFTGRIYVAPGAEKTEAYQSNRNLVGTDEARVFSKPQLEIYNDDVKCSHGSATGRLDPMQLFYLRSRGLDEETAMLLLKQAFLSDVIDRVHLPLLKERLQSLVERRIAGNDAVCGDCEICR